MGRSPRGAWGLKQSRYSMPRDPRRPGSIFVRLGAEHRERENEKTWWWMLTTDTELSGDAVIEPYQVLSLLEHEFRELKSRLRSRPVFP
ncbi:MAG: hypothetical protein ACHQ2Y_04355 [Candidatus Lutacidiplasmatales archaeon]